MTLDFSAAPISATRWPFGRAYRCGMIQINAVGGAAADDACAPSRRYPGATVMQIGECCNRTVVTAGCDTSMPVQGLSDITRLIQREMAEEAAERS